MRYLFALLLLCASAYADSTVVSSTTSIDDYYISDMFSNTNYGNSTRLSIEAGAVVRRIRIAVKGVSTLVTQDIDSAFLRFYVVAANNFGGQYANYAVVRVLKPMFEGDGTIGDGHPAGGTFVHWRDSTGTGSDSGYATMGCASAADSVDNRGDHARPDRYSTVIATLTGKASGWQSVNVTSLAQAWKASTAAENGVFIYPTTSPVYDNVEVLDDTVSIYSSEYTTDPTLTPRFVFYHAAAAATPQGSPYRQGPLGCDQKAGPNGASRRQGP